MESTNVSIDKDKGADSHNFQKIFVKTLKKLRKIIQHYDK